jgi:cytochrome c-type biogenesis protein CcmH
MLKRRPPPKRHPGGGRDPVHISVGVLVVTALIALYCVLSPAHAVEPGEMLKDLALEARARRISQELRCLVCQNQSIDDSNAELARDLRVLVRERLAAGDSDAAVLAFVEARYGEFVLLRPPLKLHTLVLWAAPLLLLVGIALYLFRRTRQRRAQAGGANQQPSQLTSAEQQRLDALLKRPPA